VLGGRDRKIFGPLEVEVSEQFQIYYIIGSFKIFTGHVIFIYSWFIY
jgi:hypothetical protein